MTWATSFGSLDASTAKSGSIRLGPSSTSTVRTPACSAARCGSASTATNGPTAASLASRSPTSAEPHVRRGRVEVLDQAGDPFWVLKLLGPGLEDGVGQRASLGGQVRSRPQFEKQGAAELFSDRGAVRRRGHRRQGPLQEAPGQIGTLQVGQQLGRADQLRRRAGPRVQNGLHLGRRGGRGGTSSPARRPWGGPPRLRRPWASRRKAIPTSTARAPRFPASSRVGSALA